MNKKDLKSLIYFRLAPICYELLCSSPKIFHREQIFKKACIWLSIKKF